MFLCGDILKSFNLGVLVNATEAAINVATYWAPKRELSIDSKIRSLEIFIPVLNDNAFAKLLVLKISKVVGDE